MKNEFAKLFNFEEHQVIVFKRTNTDDETFEVVRITAVEDALAESALGFKVESKRDEVFENFNSENANEFLKTILSMF